MHVEMARPRWPMRPPFHVMPKDVLGQHQWRHRSASASVRILSHAERTLFSLLTYAGIYVLEQKLLKSEYVHVCALARDLGAVVCEDRSDANIIVTGIKAPKRLALHTSERERDHVFIVSTDWLYACAREKACVATEPYLVWRRAKRRRSMDADNARHIQRVLAESHTAANAHSDSDATPEPETDESREDSAPVRWENSEYAVLRPTPLRTPYNQPLVDELELIRMHRCLSKDAHSELAYLRAASAVKAVPYSLADASHADLCALKGVGPKIATVICQYYKLGYIPEAKTIQADQAVQTMLGFMRLYGVGPKTAEKMYNDGARTLEDVARLCKTELSTRLGPATSLALLPDLTQRIPREQVESIRDEIAEALRSIEPGAHVVIAGGYRRGKSESGDVDLVVCGDCTPSAVLHTLVGTLQDRGRVTHTLSLPRRDDARAVDVAEVVYLPIQPRIHRRVDIVYAAPALYGAALLAWTGSALYERDLRRWAQTKGYSVRVRYLPRSSRTRVSRICIHSTFLLRLRKNTCTCAAQRTTHTSFDILGLPCMPPTLRNADP